LKEEEDHTLLNRFLSLKLLLLAVTVPISLVILYFFKLAIPIVLLTFVLGLVFYDINYTLFGLFQKLENYTMLILINLLPAVIKGIFAYFVFTRTFSFNIYYLFMVFSFSIGSSAITYFFLPRHLKKLDFRFSNVKTFFHETLSPGISQLITESFSAISNSLAKIFSSYAGVGIFSLADKISSVFVLISFTIFTVLLPKNTIRKREQKGYDYGETVILSIGVLLLAFVTIISARFFIPWFFENKFNDSLQILNIMVFAGAVSAIHTFMENYFFVENKTNYLAFISGGKLILLVLSALILIPLFSLTGLAWAYFISAGITLGVVSAMVFSDLVR
jgi:O-antigen/teichoic acid export membrane protein